MDYRNTIDVGNPKDALGKLVPILKGYGFEVAAEDSLSVRVNGPGIRSTKRNPLFGIGSLELELNGRSVDVRARIDQVAQLWLTILGLIFVPLLILAVLIPFSVQKNGAEYIGVLVLPGNMAMWAVLLPFIIRLQKRRVIRALENMVNASGGNV